MNSLIICFLQSTNGALKTINSSRLTVDHLWFSNVTRKDASDDFLRNESVFELLVLHRLGGGSRGYEEGFCVWFSYLWTWRYLWILKLLLVLESEFVESDSLPISLLHLPVFSAKKRCLTTLLFVFRIIKISLLAIPNLIKTNMHHMHIHFRLFTKDFRTKNKEDV